MKRFKALVLISALLIAFIPSIAKAQPTNNCRIETSPWNIVSLGFPLNAERLANKTNPKILILPYQLKGEPEYTFTEVDKERFNGAARNISQLSGNKSNVTLVFSEALELGQSADDLDFIKRNVQMTWQSDFENSTFGFVTKTILAGDLKIDYKGIDAVVLFGSSQSKKEYIGEAMMFTNDTSIKNNPKKSSGGSWWDPIKTSEGEISNAVLLYNDLSTDTITHEIMHLYGLTDLYGSASSPNFSIMATGGLKPATLLPYEKWVLGWLPDESVTCVNSITELSSNSANNRFTFDYSTGDKTLVIPTGSTTALIIDVFNYQQSTYLQYYSLDNNARPPILRVTPGPLRLSNFRGVSTQFQSTEYTLLVSDNDGSNVAINLIPSASIDSAESKQLINQAGEKKIEIEAMLLAKQEAEVKAAAELKAKQEAEAKAAAELAAKKEAEAKAAALKKTTITCVKGKLTRKVTAVKPICPKGYKKK